jgi:hypothetical protein
VDWGRRGHGRMRDDSGTGGRGTTTAATLHLGGAAGSRRPGAVVEEARVRGGEGAAVAERETREGG